jgi:hypothetical protein
MTSSDNLATLFFNHIAIESELREVRNQMQQVSSDPSIPAPLKALSLVRLLEVYTALEVECSRQQEAYMQAFLTILKLDELGARPITDGPLKCHLNQTVTRKQKPRSGSCITFRDPAFELRERPGSCGDQESQILSQKRRDLRAELAQLNRKKPLTSADIARREIVQEELRQFDRP